MDTNPPDLDPRKSTNSITDFFFERQVPYGAAILRILLPIVMMANLSFRWRHVRELYSSDGTPAPLADNFGYFGFLPEFSGEVCVLLFSLMMVTFAFSSIGLFTRLSLCVCTVLYAYFSLMDCLGTMTKFGVIATHFLVLLIVSECGAIWSVDSWLRTRGQLKLPFTLAAHAEERRFPIWPQRLVQLLLGIIYLGAAMTKIHTPAFFNGDQLMYWMITYLNNDHYFGEWLSQAPIVLVVFAYITIVWEIVFLFCVFTPRLRLWCLGIGAMFHIMTYFTLGLIVFPMVMISSYFTFSTESDIQWMGRLYRRVMRRQTWLAQSLRFVGTAWRYVPGLPSFFDMPAPQRLALAGAGALSFAVLAVGVEWFSDPFKIRGAEGPLALQAMDPAEVQRLLFERKPLREADKFYAFDLGTIAMGDHLVDRRNTFRRGEKIIAQIGLNPPHEDMWVECNMYDLDNKLIQRQGQIVSREMSRCQYKYDMTDSLVPGTYKFVVRSGGEVISTKTFHLAAPAGGVPAPVAD